ncbi:MAG: hypothetical protein WAT23_09780, partial [Chromatiaceae bacterium]
MSPLLCRSCIGLGLLVSALAHGLALSLVLNLESPARVSDAEELTELDLSLFATTVADEPLASLAEPASASEPKPEPEPEAEPEPEPEPVVAPEEVRPPEVATPPPVKKPKPKPKLVPKPEKKPERRLKTARPAVPAPQE